MKSGISNEIMHLINLKLEGNLSASEQQRLEDMLSGSEHARNYLRQMEELDNSLRGMADSSPQSDISPQVMRRIREAHTQQKQARVISLTERFNLKSRALLRYAAILLVGLMVGSSLTMVIFTGRFPVDRQAVVGSMASRGSQVLHFGEDDWQLQINTMAIDQTITLVLTGFSHALMQVNISFDPGVYTLIKSSVISGNPDQAVSDLGYMLRFPIDGHTRYLMVLQQQEGIIAIPLQIEVIKDGLPVFKQEFNVR